MSSSATEDLQAPPIRGKLESKLVDDFVTCQDREHFILSHLMLSQEFSLGKQQVKLLRRAYY